MCPLRIKSRGGVDKECLTVFSQGLVTRPILWRGSFKAGFGRSKDFNVRHTVENSVENTLSKHSWHPFKNLPRTASFDFWQLALLAFNYSLNYYLFIYRCWFISVQQLNNDISPSFAVPGTRENTYRYIPDKITSQHLPVHRFTIFTLPIPTSSFIRVFYAFHIIIFLYSYFIILFLFLHNSNRINIIQTEITE